MQSYARIESFVSEVCARNLIGSWTSQGCLISEIELSRSEQINQFSQEYFPKITHKSEDVQKGLSRNISASLNVCNQMGYGAGSSGVGTTQNLYKFLML